MCKPGSRILPCMADARILKHTSRVRVCGAGSHERATHQSSCCSDHHKLCARAHFWPCRVVKWHKAIGDAIEEEDLVVDVATDTLAEKGHDVGEWAGEVVMQVECHDDGYLARTFADPLDSDVKGSEPGAATGARASEALPCGVPLALICENEEDVPELSSMRGDARAVLEAVGNAVRRDATWQAFVRS